MYAHKRQRADASHPNPSAVKTSTPNRVQMQTKIKPGNMYEHDDELDEKCYGKARWQLCTKRRLLTELQHMHLPNCWSVFLPDTDNPFYIRFFFRPEKGPYRWGDFIFECNTDFTYPRLPPKFVCATPTYHPNMDFLGNMNLEIFETHVWKSHMSICTVIKEIDKVMYTPNGERALNESAAHVYLKRPVRFRDNVYVAMRGGVVGNAQYPRIIREDVNIYSLDDDVYEVK